MHGCHLNFCIKDINSPIGFLRHLISIMRMQRGGLFSAGVVCSSWTLINRGLFEFLALNPYSVAALQVSLPNISAQPVPQVERLAEQKPVRWEMSSMAVTWFDILMRVQLHTSTHK